MQTLILLRAHNCLGNLQIKTSDRDKNGNILFETILFWDPFPKAKHDIIAEKRLPLGSISSSENTSLKKKKKMLQLKFCLEPSMFNLHCDL